MLDAGEAEAAPPQEQEQEQEQPQQEPQQQEEEGTAAAMDEEVPNGGGGDGAAAAAAAAAAGAAAAAPAAASGVVREAQAFLERLALSCENRAVPAEGERAEVSQWLFQRLGISEEAIHPSLTRSVPHIDPSIYHTATARRVGQRVGRAHDGRRGVAPLPRAPPPPRRRARCVPACLPACLPACMHACMHAWLVVVGLIPWSVVAVMWSA